MATIAFAALGNALWPAAAGSFAWGSAIGAMVGSYIDSAFIMPALFPMKGATVHGARVDDINVQNTNEGAPINRSFGPENRIPASIIWFAGKGKKANWEITQRHTSKGTKWYTYHYYADIAIGLCEGEINDVKKIWADNKLLWQKQDDIAIASDKLSVSVIIIRRMETETTYMDISSAADGPDLTGLKSGVDATVAGFTNADNNGTFRCVRSWNAGSGITKARFANPDALLEAAGDDVTINQTIPEYRQGSIYTTTLYKGTATQMPDPLIESYEGAGEVPAHRDIAYMVLEHFYLADFGNRLPNFEILVDAI